MQELDKKCSAYKEIYTTKVAETRENINRLVNDHCNKFSYVSTLEELGKAADNCYMAILHNINVAAREIKEQQIDLCTLIMEQESLSENDKLLMMTETFGLVGDASAELLDYCRKLKNKIRVGCKYGCMEVFDLGEEFRDLHQEDTEVYYKCQCKCGRIHYFNEKTLASKPRFCYYPVPEMTDNYDGKYDDIGNVVIVKRGKNIPSNEYCSYYNTYRKAQLRRMKV